MRVTTSLRTWFTMLLLFVGVGVSWGEKITSPENIQSGHKYYIGATTGGNDYYFSVDASTTSDSKAGTAVTSKANATVIQFIQGSKGWNLKIDGTSYYLSLKASKDNGKVQVDDTAANFTIVTTDNGLLQIAKGNYSIQKNNSGVQFGSYTGSQTNVWLEEVAEGPEDASWQISAENVVIKAGRKAYANIRTNYDGELSVASSAPGVATASIENNVVTIIGIAEGKATITITGKATDFYKEISKTIEVEVVEGTVVPGTYTITPNNAFWGTSYSGGISGVSSGSFTLSGEKDDVTIVMKNGTSRNGFVTDTQTRVYDTYTLEFTVPTGYAITNITFTADGTNWDGTHTANVGDMKDSKTWDGVANSVIITFAGLCRITEISVTYHAAASITLNPACTDGNKIFSTYSNESAWIVPAELTVSEIGVVDGLLDVKAYRTGAIVPANTGVMVSAKEGRDYSIALTNETGTHPTNVTNCLRPSGNNGISANEMDDTDANCTFYRLTMHNGETIGYWWGAEDGAAFSLAANKAYLAVPKGAEVKEASMWFDGEEDAIKRMGSLNTSKDIYNLQGQRVDKAQKGIYIINGRKVVK